MNKAVRNLAVVAVTALAFAGCSQNPSSVATVNGVTVSEARVQEATDAVVAAFGATPAEARTFAVNRLVQGILAERIAQDNGITINQQDRAEVLAQQPQLTSLAAEPGGEDIVDDWIDISTVAQSLGTEKLVAELAKHDVVLNPRYGQWDPASGSTSGSGSLSAPAEAQR